MNPFFSAKKSSWAVVIQSAKPDVLPMRSDRVTAAGSHRPPNSPRRVRRDASQLLFTLSAAFRVDWLV